MENMRNFTHASETKQELTNTQACSNPLCQNQLQQNELQVQSADLKRIREVDKILTSPVAICWRN